MSSAGPASFTAGRSPDCSNSPRSQTLAPAIGDRSVVMKPVTVTIDYLRGAGARAATPMPTRSIERLGNRIANVDAIAWQTDRVAAGGDGADQFPARAGSVAAQPRHLAGVDSAGRRTARRAPPGASCRGRCHARRSCRCRRASGRPPGPPARAALPALALATATISSAPAIAAIEQLRRLERRGAGDLDLAIEVRGAVLERPGIRRSAGRTACAA